MLNAFGIASGVRFRYAKGKQERQHNFMPTTTNRCQPLTRCGQSYRSVRLGFHQSLILQSRDDACYRYMGYTHMPSQVLHPTLAGAVHDV